MIVSGLLVETAPEKLENVKESLSVINEVKFQEAFQYDKIMLVVEAESLDNNLAVLKQIIEMPSILNVDLQYNILEDRDTAT